MATKKDLVEAYSFSRRRLVTAFVSGAPGGREVEPARPARTIVGGAALAVLLIAGAAIAGIFSPTVPDDWTEPGRLIVSKETAERYVITDVLDDSAGEEAPPVLRPVINVTSARLILGSDVEPLIVPQDEIDTQQIGDAIGILGGPANLPSADHLVASDWSACTAQGRGIRVAFADDSPVTRVDAAGFPVRVGQEYYMVATSADEEDGVPRAYRYRLPGNRGARDNMLTAIFQDQVNSLDAVPVSRDWLALFPEGGDLAFGSFGIEGAGDPDPQAGQGGIPSRAEVGDLLEVGGERFLLTSDGPVQISAFADAVYSNLPDEPRVRTSDRLDLGRVAAPYDGNHWPEASPTQTEDPDTPCAVLLPQEEGAAPGVVPGVITGGDGEVDASPDLVPADVSSPRVQAGRGAFVLSADWDSPAGGAPFVIDSNGASYSLLGSESAELLGYAEVEPRLIPDSWRELFDEGVSLSPDAALCPPTPEEQVSC